MIDREDFCVVPEEISDNDLREAAYCLMKDASKFLGDLLERIDCGTAIIRHHVSRPVLQDFYRDCIQVHVQLRKQRENLHSASHRLSHKTTPQALTKEAGEPGEV